MNTINATTAMAGLSVHTQRCYQRWIAGYLAQHTGLKPSAFDFSTLNVQLLKSVLTVGNLKSWLGQLKARNLGKQSLGQAKAAIVFVAQTMADAGENDRDYDIARALSGVKLPKAETGQNPGHWLTPRQISTMLNAERPAKRQHGSIPVTACRNRAILLLLAVCGLRRAEVIASQWQDLSFEGGHNLLRVHGKGQKLRVVKLPELVAGAINAWHGRCNYPETGPIFVQIGHRGQVTATPLGDYSVRNVVCEAARQVGLPDVSPHDLRRSFARNAHDAGASFEQIRQTLGHSNLAVTERYVNSVLDLNATAQDIIAEGMK